MWAFIKRCIRLYVTFTDLHQLPVRTETTDLLLHRTLAECTPLPAGTTQSSQLIRVEIKQELLIKR